MGAASSSSAARRRSTEAMMIRIAVGTPGAGLGDLIGVIEEILAQHRQITAARAAVRNSGAPWKEGVSVRTDRQAAPPGLIGAGERADQNPAGSNPWRGLLS
jgi:hypothetical protein